MRDKYLNKGDLYSFFQIDLLDIWKIYDLHYIE